jgi:hypothetical protein
MHRANDRICTDHDAAMSLLRMSRWYDVWFDRGWFTERVGCRGERSLRDHGVGIFRRADGTPRECMIERCGRDARECRCNAIDEHARDGRKGKEWGEEQGQDRGPSWVQEDFG